MIAPTSDAYSSVIRFSIPPRERLVAAAVAVLVLAFGLAVWSALAVPPGMKAAALVIAFAVSAAFALRALRREAIDLDLESRSYSRRYGIGPSLRRDEVRLESPLAVRYSANESHNAMNGAPEQVYDAWLDVAGRRLPLVSGWKEDRAWEFLELLADRISSKLEPVDSAASERTHARFGVIATWACAIAVFCVMFWPVLSGQRKFRPAWASPFIQNASEFSRRQRPFARAQSLYTEGKFEEAEKLFREAIDSGAERADCLNMIAYCQAGRKQFDLALATAEQALGLQPDNGMIVDTVGEMHELRGEFEIAVKYYKDALKTTGLPEPKAETHAKLGRSLLQLGRRKEAIAHLTEAARYPNDRYGNTAVGILRTLHVPSPRPANYGGMGFSTPPTSRIPTSGGPGASVGGGLPPPPNAGLPVSPSR